MMIWIEITAVIVLVIFLVAMIRDKKKHPEDYKIPERRKKHHKTPEYRYTGLPWMGGKKIRNR